MCPSGASLGGKPFQTGNRLKREVALATHFSGPGFLGGGAGPFVSFPPKRFSATGASLQVYPKHKDSRKPASRRLYGRARQCLRGKDIQTFFPNTMHYSTEHAGLLPSGSDPLPMPDTRLEALWLLLCLEERRRMLPCQAGPLEHAGGAGFHSCFRAADHAEQVGVGPQVSLGS